MACIDKIYSVSVLLGSGKCNANCEFCAGKYLRKEADKRNLLYEKNLESAIKLSARYGGWSLSLTSSGEPTCSPDDVTSVLRIYSKCAYQGAYFPNVNLFTNGILFGNKDFCARTLPIWKEFGLTNVAVSIHSVNEYNQAQAYGIDYYPSFSLIKENIEQYGIGVRATLLLRKGGVETIHDYKSSISKLTRLGYNNITSWPIGNPDGSRNEFTPSRWNLLKIRYWLYKNAKKCHGHVWGGGVFDWKGNILRYTDYVTKHDPDNDFVRQLVVFQDGTVSYSWIREGALCMK